MAASCVAHRCFAEGIQSRQQKGDGIGFKTTESGKMMRIPLRKEAQHFQIMGDTGVGKTQLIMQMPSPDPGAGRLRHRLRSRLRVHAAILR